MENSTQPESAKWARGVLYALIAVSAFFRPVMMSIESHTEAQQVPAPKPI